MAAATPVVDPSSAPSMEDQVGTVCRLQQAHPLWLVLWSPWRRTFTAFACFTKEPVVLDARGPQQLHMAMDHTEQQHKGLAAMLGLQAASP